jgi:DNA modification methylase
VSVEILIGDALEQLRTLPDASIDMCVTSPPYWGLRDYGVEGQLGLEPTLGEHIAALVEIFEEVRRVLKPTGSFWLNYGDCYATSPNGRSAADTKDLGQDDRTFRDKPFSTVGPIYGAEGGSDRPGKPANGTKRRGGGNNPSGPIARLEIDDSPRNRSRRGRSGNLGNGGLNGVGIPGARVVGDGGRYEPEYAKTVRGKWNNADSRVTRVEHSGRIVAGGYLKPKDLCMIPNRLAIALQDAGWWVRSEIVWGKPNAMPDSSGVYRPSTSHEKIFLLTREGGDVYRARDTGEISFSPDLKERCPLITDPSRDAPRWINIETYYDAVAVRMPPAEASLQRWSQDIENQAGSTRANAGGKTNGTMKAVGGAKKPPKKRGAARPHSGFDLRWDHMTVAEQRGNGRLLRNYEPDLSAIVPPEVWEIATASYSGAHFATFPPALVAPCIMAGCPKGGTVLDPFGGAGTTALVAEALGRDSILIELNPESVELANLRIRSRNARAHPPCTKTAKPGLLALLDHPPVDEVAP